MPEHTESDNPGRERDTSAERLSELEGRVLALEQLLLGGPSPLLEGVQRGEPFPAQV